ncbi:FMN-linked oxidoreductase [Pluteus cervinus]|uniref:FMN-linked oxidoreductase n=1 Tax=Pluteus cervinus TaxID=181527 RepID=A0ACD3B7G3_9AGAR|nr:FMN-linked oxidoreductase [Pluteus cervinus]
MVIQDHLRYVAAPMVGQSDAPFRLLTRKYGATVAYTQMLLPEKLLNDQSYLEHHLRDLRFQPPNTSEVNHRPVVVQLCGNDPELIIQAARQIQNDCDAIDLNLGCPQEAAKEGHFGAYLLGQKDWPVVQEIVSSMSKSLTVPTSVKMRLCQPVDKTVDLGKKLEACGASWLTLHARTVSARRRRQGPADLRVVKLLKDALSVPVISNGNIRSYNNLQENLDFTGADGIMIGEPLLDNPCLFANIVPDPVDISLEYLELCRIVPAVAPIPIIQTHIRHFVDSQCGRRPWFTKFRTALSNTSSIDEIEHLLLNRVQRWRGRSPAPASQIEEEIDIEEADGMEGALEGLVLLK